MIYAVKCTDNAMIYIYTSSAFNYLSKVKILAESIKRFLPDSRIVLALADKIQYNIDFNEYCIDEVMPVTDFQDEFESLDAWVFQHTIVELATAIKPLVLERLLDRDDCDAVLYFDPDIVLFSEIDDLLEKFQADSILLTPHQTTPECDIQHIIDNEICSLKHGVFNFGFYGVKKSAEGRKYAKWWKERVKLFCYDDIPNGIFTDQKWNDLVPALFNEVCILKSPRFNVASWNTTQRKLSGDFDKGFQVNGEQLGFYHFTGFDCGDHKTMVHKNSCAPKVQLKLVNWYQNLIEVAAKDLLCRIPWCYGEFDNHEPVSDTMRKGYRIRSDLQKAFPLPFKVGQPGKSFYYWWIAHAIKEGLCSLAD